MATAVWDYGLVTADIAARIGYATIDGSSSPTSTQVTAWITEICAALNAELEALGVTPSAITSTAHVNEYHRIRHAAAEYVAALWHAANQRDDTEWARLAMERYNSAIGDMRSVAERFLGSHDLGRARSSVTTGASATGPPTVWHDTNGFD
jgi:hypothetical protein